jgi:hypothetical protein
MFEGKDFVRAIIPATCVTVGDILHSDVPLLNSRAIFVR